MHLLDFLKVVRMVFWSGVLGPLARSRFALTVALRAQKLDLWASLCISFRLEQFQNVEDSTVQPRSKFTGVLPGIYYR